MLIAATSGNDAAFLADRLGSVASGKLADLVAVDSDPTRIDILRKVRMVMKGGTVVLAK